MSVKQTSIHCEGCERPMLHAKQQFSGAMGLLLTLFTFGLFLPIWLVLDHQNAKRGWLCQMCGMQNKEKKKGFFG